MIRRLPSLTAVAVGIVLLASACGSAGTPNSYSDQPRDFDGEELSITEGNYRAGCEAANDEASIANAAEYCRCTFDGFVDNVPFEVFQAYDARVKTGVDNGTITSNDDLYENFQESYEDIEDFEGFEAFKSAMKELEDRSSDTRALEELFATCN